MTDEYTLICGKCGGPREKVSIGWCLECFSEGMNISSNKMADKLMTDDQTKDYPDDYIDALRVKLMAERLMYEKVKEIIERLEKLMNDYTEGANVALGDISRYTRQGGAFALYEAIDIIKEVMGEA